jgi:hypothetical protein
VRVHEVPSICARFSSSNGGDAIRVTIARKPRIDQHRFAGRHEERRLSAFDVHEIHGQVAALRTDDRRHRNSQRDDGKDGGGSA